MSAVARPDRTLRDEHDHTFWAWCERGELRMQRCTACGHWAWPPVPRCEACDSDTFTWTQFSGRGRVRSYCTFERSYYPQCPAPWTVILVELEEGVLFISDPADLPTDELRDGLPVRLRFLRCSDRYGEFNLPVFEKD